MPTALRNKRGNTTELTVSTDSRDNASYFTATGEPLAEDDQGLVGCLRAFGTGLLAAGSSVGVIENTLAQIAGSYGKSCEIVALPNVLMIRLIGAPQAAVDFTVQRLTSLRLDQMSALVQLLDDVQRKVIPPGAAPHLVDQLLARPHRFGTLLIVLGYVLSCLGLTLLYRPEPLALIATGAAGLLVGVMVLWFQQRPRFDLLLSVIAAFGVSTVMFCSTLGYLSAWCGRRSGRHLAGIAAEIRRQAGGCSPGSLGSSLCAGA